MADQESEFSCSFCCGTGLKSAIPSSRLTELCSFCGGTGRAGLQAQLYAEMDSAALAELRHEQALRSLAHDHAKAVAERDAALSQLTEARDALIREGMHRDEALDVASEAIDLAEDGWQYASEYLRDKWDVPGQIAELRRRVESRRPQRKVGG